MAAWGFVAIDKSGNTIGIISLHRLFLKYWYKEYWNE